MWTIKQANRTSLVVDILSIAVIAALAFGGAIRRDWSQMAAFLMLTAGIGFTSWRRRHRRDPQRDHTAAIMGSLARDERDAYIQLRAWALVGQAAYFAALVMLGIGSIQARPLLLWPMLAVIVLYHGSLIWLRQRN